MTDEAGSSQTEVVGTIRGRPGHVNKMKNEWRNQEDYWLAYKLQELEYENHYGQNRNERQQVGVKVSKVEQNLEDVYAAEYWEQVRRDREMEDEKVAREIQVQLEAEEKRKLNELAEKDEALARKYQERIEQKQWFEQGLSLVQQPAKGDDKRDREMEKYLEDLKITSGRTSRKSKSEPPSGISMESWDRMKKERQKGRRVHLPPGISPEQQAAIQQALRDEDSRLAQEVQDMELARFLQKKEEKRLKKLASEEQIDNEVNQAAAMIQSSAKISIKQGKVDEPNLISFDEDVPKSKPSGEPMSSRPPPSRPPPPKLNSFYSRETEEIE